MVQAFYPNDDDEAAATCQAWYGDVTDILSHDEAGGGEEAVQADPYGCGGLWERFMVGWQPFLPVCPASAPSCSSSVLVSVLCVSVCMSSPVTVCLHDLSYFIPVLLLHCCSEFCIHSVYVHDCSCISHWQHAGA